MLEPEIRELQKSINTYNMRYFPQYVLLCTSTVHDQSGDISEPHKGPKKAENSGTTRGGYRGWGTGPLNPPSAKQENIYH